MELILSRAIHSKQLWKGASVNSSFKRAGFVVMGDISLIYVHLCVCVFLAQAHVLVCRALSNMLLLPWPCLPESEQQWPSRSSNHARLVSTLTQQYRLLPRPPAYHPNSKPSSGEHSHSHTLPSLRLCLMLAYTHTHTHTHTHGQLS